MNHDSYSGPDIPESFLAIYTSARGRRIAALGEIGQRFDFCEDLANLLTEQAQAIYHNGHASEEGVLLGLHSSLAAPGSVVSPPEARWVVLRLAELLRWRSPELPQPEAIAPAP